jgi:hypothetical protein
VVTVTGNGTYHSDDPGMITGSAVPTTAGMYQWTAAYSGDSNNHMVSTRFGDEPELVNPFTVPNFDGKLLFLGHLAPGQLEADTAFVNGLYEKLLNRAPDQAGINSAVLALEAGASRSAVANAIAHSAEALGITVDGLYQRFLSRNADPAGRAALVSYLQNGGNLGGAIQVLIASLEYQSRFSSDSAFVQSLYQNLLYRTGGAAEVANHVQALHNGATRAVLVNSFLNSTEYRAQVVARDYTRFLGRTASTSDVMAWVSAIQNWVVTQDAVAVLFLSSAEFYAHPI